MFRGRRANAVHITGEGAPMTEKTLPPPIIQATWPMVASVLGGMVTLSLALAGLGAQAFFHLDGKITSLSADLGGQISEVKESVARLEERLTAHMESGHE